MTQEQIREKLQEAAKEMENVNAPVKVKEEQNMIKVVGLEVKDSNRILDIMGETKNKVNGAREFSTTKKVQPKDLDVEDSADVLSEDIICEEDMSEEGAKKESAPNIFNPIPGVEIIDENTAVIAKDSMYGNRLHMRAMLSKQTNRRKYLVFEVNSKGEELGTTSCDALFAASDVENGSSKIKKLIKDLSGQYAGQITDILSKMCLIEKRRLLAPAATLDIDACKTFEELYIKLENWFSEHLDDVRVGVVDINGKTHIALVKRGRANLNEIFKSVCKEIAPNLKSTFIKGELYRRGLLNHDSNSLCNDTQLTIGVAAKVQLGVLNDKIISFVFDEKIIQSWKVGYEILHADYEEEE